MYFRYIVQDVSSEEVSYSRDANKGKEDLRGEKPMQKKWQVQNPEQNTSCMTEE